MSEYKYKTMDEDGEWWVWKVEPAIGDNVWVCTSSCANDGKMLSTYGSRNLIPPTDWAMMFYCAAGFDCRTGTANDVLGVKRFKGRPIACHQEVKRTTVQSTDNSDVEQPKECSSIDTESVSIEQDEQPSCVDELFNLIGDKNVSVSFDCGGQDKTITIVDSDGKTYLATSVEELKEILSAIDTLTKYYYAQ